MLISLVAFGFAKRATLGFLTTLVAFVVVKRVSFAFIVGVPFTFTTFSLGFCAFSVFYALLASFIMTIYHVVT